MKLRNTLIAALVAMSSLAGLPTAQAATGAAAVDVDATLVTPVSGGCGPNGWRGPWGHCRYNGGGWYSTPVYNGCPRGYWRGPWGHCRNTPYHGRLPNGGWK